MAIPDCLCVGVFCGRHRVLLLLLLFCALLSLLLLSLLLLLLLPYPVCLLMFVAFVASVPASGSVIAFLRFTNSKHMRLSDHIADE